MLNTEPVMPAFVFERRQHVEREGFILAGQLVVDIPKQPRKRHMHMVTEIIANLTAAARSGSLPDSGLVVGWRGGSRPANAADIDDDEVMSAWAKQSLVIAVRVPPDGDHHIRIDSDTLAQMGLGPSRH